MSLFDYKMSIKISIADYPFYALIMAAIRQADNENLATIERAFPEVYKEFWTRYNAPEGILPEERA